MCVRERSTERKAVPLKWFGCGIIASDVTADILTHTVTDAHRSRGHSLAELSQVPLDSHLAVSDVAITVKTWRQTLYKSQFKGPSRLYFLLFSLPHLVRTYDLVLSVLLQPLQVS